MKITNILIASAILAASSGLAFANGGTFTPPAPHHTGYFYLGAGAGWFTTDYDAVQRTSNTYNYINSFESFSETLVFNRVKHHSLDDEGWSGQLFAGYEMLFKNKYTLGVEISGSLQNDKAKFSSRDSFDDSFFDDQNQNTVSVQILSSEQKKIEREYTIGLSVLPGIKITNDVTVFGRVGWVLSKFDLRLNDSFNAASTISLVFPEQPPILLASTDFNSQMSKRINKCRSGIQLGVGANIEATKNFYIRGDWSWSRYAGFNAIIKSSKKGLDNEDNFNRFQYAHSVKVEKPTVSQFMLSAIYRFT